MFSLPWSKGVHTVLPLHWDREERGEGSGGRSGAGLWHGGRSLHRPFLETRGSPFSLIKSALSYRIQSNLWKTVLQSENKPRASGQFSGKLERETIIWKSNWIKMTFSSFSSFSSRNSYPWGPRHHWSKILFTRGFQDDTVHKADTDFFFFSGMSDRHRVPRI